MRTGFGSLYAEHVDLDEIGFDATPVNDRWISDEGLASVFGKADAMAIKMDELGFDTFPAAEHHFQREGYECLPNLLLMYVHMAHLTKNLKFGCGFNVNPMWHPLLLAEDYATADILTGAGSYSAFDVDTIPGKWTPSECPAPSPTATPTERFSKNRSISS